MVNKKAIIEYTSGFAGDALVTHVDVNKVQWLLDYAPKTLVEEGVSKRYERYFKTMT